MEIKRVCILYFSATGNTEKTVGIIGETLAEAWGVPLERFSFTRPAEREKEYAFQDTDFVMVGAPTYAGKLPNKILPDFQGKLHGNGALAAAVVTFGNRSYDNSLAELCAVLEADGFHTAAGGAFVGRHAFTDRLAEGRPDWNDRQDICNEFRYAEAPKPSCYDEMLDIARKLSAPFPFVRVDLYDIGGKPVFGELTFAPGGEHSAAAQKEMGELLHMERMKEYRKKLLSHG